jgi:hypothetical protein
MSIQAKLSAYIPVQITTSFFERAGNLGIAQVSKKRKEKASNDIPCPMFYLSMKNNA